MNEKHNYEHYTLNAATPCADGVKIKHHGSCVASRILRLLATCPAPGHETARFERDLDLPSNTRQQPSHMEAQLTAAEVLKPKDTDLSSSDGEDDILQHSTDCPLLHPGHKTKRATGHDVRLLAKLRA